METATQRGLQLEDGEGFVHETAGINGLSSHFVTLGEGPAVLLCHGFPDLWRGWRRQMKSLAAQGYRAIAPDLRGFGDSEGPDDQTAYTSVDVVGDLVALLDHLGIAQAAIVGHDWGATIAWAAALLRPDRFVAVAALSVPYTPRGPMSITTMLRRFAPPDLYMLYFLEQGPADRELDANPAKFLRGVFASPPALVDGSVPMWRLAPSGKLFDAFAEPASPPPWFDDQELAIYAKAFARTGFTRPLNTYRSLDRSWQLLAAWGDATVTVPAFYIGADLDVVRYFPGMKDAIDNMGALVPKARPPVILEGAGHFMQMEKPEEVSRLLIEFLHSIFNR